MNLLNRKAIYKTLAAIGTVSVSMALQACSSSDESATTAATSTEATITGTLSVASSSSARLSKLGRGIAGNASNNALALEGSTVSCTNADGELLAEGTVAADGTFSVTGTTTQSMGCAVIDTSGEALANFIFENPSQKSLDGNNQFTDQVQLGGTADLGGITIDTVSGNATVDVSKFADKLAKLDIDPAKVTGLTGHYVIKQTPIPADAAKAGYKPVISMEQGKDGGGPPDGYPLYLKVVHGTTTTGEDAYGVLVWNHADDDKACGYKVGSTAAEMKDKMGITLDGDVAGEFTYSTTATVNGVTHTLTDGWKSDRAVSQWSMQDCESSEVNGDHVWACYDGDGTRQIGRGGGCTLAASSEAAQGDFSQMSWENASCVNSTTADGYNRNECTIASAPLQDGSTASVVCVNESKVEVPVDTSVPRAQRTYTTGTYSDFDFSTVAVKLAQGALCSSATDELAALQCYSQYFYEQGFERAGSSGSCMKRIDTNWTATTAEDFVRERGPAGLNVRALGTVGKNASGNPTLTALSYNIEYRGVRIESSSGSSYVPCKVATKEKMAFSKGAVDGELLATYESFSVNLSTDVPACVAEYDGTPERFMFKFVAITAEEATAQMDILEAQMGGHH